MPKNKELREYSTLAGKIPVRDWLNKLKDKLGRVKIRSRIDNLETGHYGNCEPVGEGVFELKIAFGPGYRVYFAEHKDIVIFLLCGGDKSTQTEDIKKAKMYWKELKERLKNESK